MNAKIKLETRVAASCNLDKDPQIFVPVFDIWYHNWREPVFSSALVLNKKTFTSFYTILYLASMVVAALSNNWEKSTKLLENI